MNCDVSGLAGASYRNDAVCAVGIAVSHFDVRARAGADVADVGTSFADNGTDEVFGNGNEDSGKGFVGRRRLVSETVGRVVGRWLKRCDG